MTWVQKNIGNVHKVPHIIYQQTASGSKRIVVSHELRSLWLKEITSVLDVYFIYGELSSIDGIEQSIYDNDYAIVNLIFGDGFYNQKNKNELIRLIREKPDRLKVYSMSERPPNHGFLIGNNILFEDLHSPGVHYIYATVIENAKPETINAFISTFNSLKGDRQPLTADELEEIWVDENLSKKQANKNSYTSPDPILV